MHYTNFIIIGFLIALKINDAKVYVLTLKDVHYAFYAKKASNKKHV
jgi:hypothetical protein